MLKVSAVPPLAHSGTFAVVSLMTGSVVEQLVPTPLEMNSSSSAATELEAQRIGVASAVALLSGIIMVKHGENEKCVENTAVDVVYGRASLAHSSACVAFSWASSPLTSRSRS